jgi:hypothetical protein
VGWTPEQMRFEVQRRHTVKRHGAGGRPRRKLEGHGPEVTLRELERHSSRWLEFHESVWSGVKGRDWKRMVRDWPAEGRPGLRELLETTEEALGRLEAASREVRGTLAKLKQGL